MSKATAPLARTLPMLPHARHHRRGQRALLRNRVLRVLVAALVAERTAAGMTQQEVAMRMWTTKSAVSRLGSGRYARPDLDTVEKIALAFGARVEIRCARAGRAIAPQRGRWRRRMNPVSRKQPFSLFWPNAEIPRRVHRSTQSCSGESDDDGCVWARRPSRGLTTAITSIILEL